MVPVVEVPAPLVVAFEPLTLEGAWRVFRRQIHASRDEPMLAGSIEMQIQAHSKQVLRSAAREAFQAQADACSPRCPWCAGPLTDVEQAERSVLTQWGEVTIRRPYGRCKKCKKYVAPADVALGLEPHEQTSPDMAEKLSWLATQMPPAQAAEVFEHLTGQAVSPSRVERQAKKKGTQALLEREEDRERAMSAEHRFEFSRQHKPQDEPEAFTLVLVPDAWMMRERDDWGRSQAMRRKGETPQRWHEVKSARLFRLDHRAELNERAVLLDSVRVATRQGLEVFGELLWTEAMRLGMARAEQVLIIADGGVWIWNLAQDRFPWAKGTLDFYHASQHLWAVAHALFAHDEQRARRWVEPLLHQLRHGEHGRVIQKLDRLNCKHAQSEFAGVIQRECAYFESHRDHIDYQAKADRGEPIGSGAVESLCKQYQMRFKRPGQFWLKENAERLLELENRRCNKRWNSLWPHRRPLEN